MPIAARKDRTKFKRRILHVYQGQNEDGIAVYKTYHDNFFANQAALEKLHQDQLDVGTALDQEERAATRRAVKAVSTQCRVITSTRIMRRSSRVSRRCCS